MHHRTRRRGPGATASIPCGTSHCHRPAPDDYAQAWRDDLAYRETILEAVRAGATFREIAVAVEEALIATGYRNCHRLHPGEVLGHRVGHVGDVSEPDEHGFAHQLVTWFFAQIATEPPVVPAPTWTTNPGSDHTPAEGLWAVEPHLAIGARGVKWEEILVIEGADAYWLDEPPQ